MNGLRIGGLFEGYGGLTAGVRSVLGGELAWYSEIEPAACRLLDHHHPDVPNLGDITAVDWAEVETVDVLTGGFPCQDVSAAGRRAGIRPGTRSGLWSHMAYAIDRLRPELVVIENVRGLLSADAHCDVEPCPWCLGDHEGRPLRALGAVLGDLAGLGYVGRWHGLRAADIGAPHGRFRVFIAAWPAADSAGLGRRAEGWDDGLRAEGLEPISAPDPDSLGQVRDGGARSRRPGPADNRLAVSDASGAGRGSRGWEQRGPSPSDPRDCRQAVRAGETQPRGRSGVPAHAQGDGRGEGWPEPARQLRGPDAPGSGDAAPDPDGDPVREQPVALAGGGGPTLAGQPVLDWGAYEPAVRRWELILGRSAPAATQTGKRGGQQLSPLFVEWLMGLPTGHVTAVPGLSRNEQLKLLGNGVVPAQAAAALRHLLVADALQGAA